jgi:hypothetical protein
VDNARLSTGFYQPLIAQNEPPCPTTAHTVPTVATYFFTVNLRDRGSDLLVRLGVSGDEYD